MARCARGLTVALEPVALGQELAYVVVVELKVAAAPVVLGAPDAGDEGAEGVALDDLGGRLTRLEQLLLAELVEVVLPLPVPLERVEREVVTGDHLAVGAEHGLAADLPVDAQEVGSLHHGKLDGVVLNRETLLPAEAGAQGRGVDRGVGL